MWPGTPLQLAIFSTDQKKEGPWPPRTLKCRTGLNAQHDLPQVMLKAHSFLLPPGCPSGHEKLPQFCPATSFSALGPGVFKQGFPADASSTRDRNLPPPNKKILRTAVPMEFLFLDSPMACLQPRRGYRVSSTCPGRVCSCTASLAATSHTTHSWSICPLCASCLT